MSSPDSLRKTPLHEWHCRNNANMAEFGGYEMPLWYPTGAKHEHRAVISAAGLFDTSHMAILTLSGEGALPLLQHCFTRDLRFCVGREPGPLTAGRSVYGVFLRPDGTVLDDAIVSQLAGQEYMVVVNAGMGPAVSQHLLEQAGDAVEIADHSGMIGKIDLQGPASARIIAELLEAPDETLDDMVYFSFKGDLFTKAANQLSLKGGVPVLLSRTGYTGEFGFELCLFADDTETVWQRLLGAGQPYGVAACGLAARDSLRAGAMLPLSHQDIGNWVFANTPWSFALPWAPGGQGFTKDFIGASAVSAGAGSEYTYGFAGYDPRKITAGEGSVVLDKDGRSIGTVLTCTTDMAIGRVGERIVSLATPESSGRPAGFQARGLSCGFVKVSQPLKAGDLVRLSEGKRAIEVEIRVDIRPDRTARFPMREMRRNL